MPEQTNTIEDSSKENGQVEAASPSQPEPTEASPTMAEPTPEPTPAASEPTMPVSDRPVLTTDEPVGAEQPLAPPTPEPPVEPTLPISTPVSSEPLPTSDSAETSSPTKATADKLTDKPRAITATDEAATSASIGLIAKLKEKLGQARQKKQQKIAANLENIMAYALEKQKITNDEVERLTKISDRQALRYLKLLVKQGRLVRFGSKRNTFYKPIK